MAANIGEILVRLVDWNYVRILAINGMTISVTTDQGANLVEFQSEEEANAILEKLSEESCVRKTR